MVTTAIRARTNSRGDKSTLRGGAGKGGGGLLRMVGALSIRVLVFGCFFGSYFLCFFVLSIYIYIYINVIISL